MAPPPPSPSHIIRSHASQINFVSFSDDNERLYSGDLSGTVVVTSTRTMRSISTWKAHKDGILGIQEWGSSVATHGRDNKLHVWTRIIESRALGDAALRVDNPEPTLRYSLDVNALNFCRLSLLPLTQVDSAGTSRDTSKNDSALLAVPNLVESSLADIWELPACRRLHAAIGKAPGQATGITSAQSDGRSAEDKTGILMSLHLFKSSKAYYCERLHLLSAYESGEVALRCYVDLDREISIEGRGWECIWKTKQHAESVMAMSVSLNNTFAITVSADHLVVRYNLFEGPSGSASGVAEGEAGKGIFSIYRIKQPGNAAVALRDDGRICAVGGWDGKIRLFSTKSFKLLGTLTYHAKSCQAVAFAHFSMGRARQDSEFDRLDSESDEGSGPVLERVDDEADMTQEEKEARRHWIAGGSQDHRLTIWELMDFEGKRNIAQQ